MLGRPSLGVAARACAEATASAAVGGGEREKGSWAMAVAGGRAVWTEKLCCCI